MSLFFPLPLHCVALFFLVFGFLSTPVSAQLRVGELVETMIETPHPYAQGGAARPTVWSHTLRHPGATFLKLHFAAFAVDGAVSGGIPAGDYVVLKNGGGVTREVLSGIVAEDLWSRSFPGDEVTIELHADGKENAFGLQIDRYGYGTQPLYPRAETSTTGLIEPPRSTCGGNDKTSICDTPRPERIRLADPVGRVLFAGDCGGMFLCTGFLFSPGGKFMTNAHCAHSPRESRSLEAWFNYIDSGEGGTTECGLPERPDPDVFRARQFLQKDCALDFAVHLLDDPSKGNPAEIYGYLPLSAREPVITEPVWIPQHAEGRKKAIAEANATVSTSVVEGVRFCDDQRRCSSFVGTPTGVLSDFGYTADTSPGSSGSPVLDESNQVIGLHHAGNCVGAAGENLGVQMAAILRELGAAPEAQFTTTPKKRNGRLPFSLTFDGSSSVDVNGGVITEYHWDFGDGSPEVIGPDAVVGHTYTVKGTFRIFLWVTNDKGRRAEHPATRQAIVRK